MVVVQYMFHRKYCYSVLFSVLGYAMLAYSAVLAQSATPIITVWVHGTEPEPVTVFPLFLKNFLFRKPGLHLAQDYAPHSYKKHIVTTVSQTDPAFFPADHFYIFGWSGKLDFTAREEAGKQLHDALQELYKNIHAQYQQLPLIRLITHSHGGNVALNMVRYKTEHTLFSIHELILLACPIQQKTCEYVHNALFEHIISLYSTADFVQIADPQRLYALHEAHIPLFSQRCFSATSPVTQLQVWYPIRGLLHTEFIFAAFLAHLPKLIQEVRACNYRPGHYQVILHPSHTEWQLLS
jgi:hypothetical protein